MNERTLGGRVEILLIVVGIVALAAAASVLFKWTDRWRQMRRERRRAEAEEYIAIHGILTTAIRQAYDGKNIDAKLLTARLAAADPAKDTQEATAVQSAVTDFLDDCEELIADLKTVLAYDHKYFKKMPVTYRERIAVQHEKWHDTRVSLSKLAIQLEDVRKQYIH